jgi:pimeloyl-ACP methyl ester carboxylesterase
MVPRVAPSTIEERTLEVDGVRAFYRQVEGSGVPTVYCHGNPTHSEDWLPFLERGGPAIAIDLPGWGRSDRPDPSHFDYSMHGLAAFLDRALEELGIGEHNLVVHDWGCVALIGAQRQPERIKRLVLINAVPLLPGYRWHWVARIWRRRGLGELSNATTTKPLLALTLRQSRGDRSAMPRSFVEMIWRHWDRGSKRAMLELYRAADPPLLAAAGRDLQRLGCPSLVLWGGRDPYIPPRFASAYADALPAAELEIRQSAGHWPWIDDPSVIDRVLDFLESAR